MDIMRDLESVGGRIKASHLVLESGKHASDYLNFDPLFTRPWTIMEVGRELATPFFDHRIEVVAAPATGGVMLASMAALSFSDVGPDVYVAWADKTEDGDFVFERAGFPDILKGRRVLLVDDVMTNDDERGSVFKVCRQVEQCGGIVVAVSVACNRSQGRASSLRVPQFHAIEHVDFPAYEETECPMCAARQPIITDVGHGSKYQARLPDYPGGFTTLAS